MWLRTIVRISHTIQVWGIASFVVVTGLSTTFYLINESHPHTFFMFNCRFGGEWHMTLVYYGQQSANAE